MIVSWGSNIIVIKQLFRLFLQGVEGEIAATLKSNQISDILIQQIGENGYKSSSKIGKILFYSLFKCTWRGIFEAYDFKNKDIKRKVFINRNWILHGRDNPSQWREVDALRLFNILNSIQFLQEIIEEERGCRN